MAEKGSDQGDARSPKDSRDERLSAALRANLHRRKAQSRARKASEEAPPGDADETQGDGSQS